VGYWRVYPVAERTRLHNIGAKRDDLCLLSSLFCHGERPQPTRIFRPDPSQAAHAVFGGCGDGSANDDYGVDASHRGRRRVSQHYVPAAVHTGELCGAFSALAEPGT